MSGFQATLVLKNVQIGKNLFLKKHPSIAALNTVIVWKQFSKTHKWKHRTKKKKQKKTVKFSIKDFFRKCDKIRRFLWI